MGLPISASADFFFLGGAILLFAPGATNPSYATDIISLFRRSPHEFHFDPPFPFFLFIFFFPPFFVVSSGCPLVRVPVGSPTQSSMKLRHLTLSYV